MAGIDVITLALAKKYTRESLLGGGAVVGKNVVVQSITPIDGGNRVTFGYTLDDGTPKTSYMDVMNGVDGKDASGEITQEEIQEVVEKYLEENPISYENLEGKPTINGVELSGDLSLEDIGITDSSSDDNIDFDDFF